MAAKKHKPAQPLQIEQKTRFPPKICFCVIGDFRKDERDFCNSDFRDDTNFQAGIGGDNAGMLKLSWDTIVGKALGAFYRSA